MSKTYDFILFENYHQAFNHKYDVVLIAKLLKYTGLDVAILDIYHEDNSDDIDGIPVLHLTKKNQIPNDQWQRRPKNKLISWFCLIRFLWQQHKYIRQVINEIEPFAERFYCGSYHLNMPLNLLKIRKPCYYWGLRSSRMTNFWYHFKRNPVLGIRMLMLRHAFRKNPDQNLFVSNAIIKNEFERIGIPSWRLIIREERCITDLGFPNYENLSPRFSLLTIGMLRPDKRVGFTITEFKQCREEEWQYVLVGKSQGKYENEILSAINHNDNIRRINKFIDYKEFNNYIKEAHFVVFADKKQKSSVTNGTMLETLINYRPIIAPNYDPYKTYIDKYGIGLTFNPDVYGDLSRVMKEAESLGSKSFHDNIENFLKTIKFDYVAKMLYDQIYNRHEEKFEN